MANIQILDLHCEAQIEDLSYDVTGNIFGGTTQANPNADEWLISYLIEQAGGLNNFLDALFTWIFGQDAGSPV